MSAHALGRPPRPYNQLTFAEACQRIAAAGYSDVAVFAHNREMPVDSGSSADGVLFTIPYGARTREVSVNVFSLLTFCGP